MNKREYNRLKRMVEKKLKADMKALDDRKKARRKRPKPFFQTILFHSGPPFYGNDQRYCPFFHIMHYQRTSHENVMEWQGHCLYCGISSVRSDKELKALFYGRKQTRMMGNGKA